MYLNAAIAAANADTSVGACPAGSGPDTLVLEADVPLTVVDNTVYGTANGLPPVTSKITIEGNGYSVYRDTSASPPKFRIFHVFPSGDLTLEGVFVTSGVADGVVDNGGGGIRNNGSLALRNSTVAFNTAGKGGGILTTFNSVTRIEQSVVSANVANEEYPSYQGTGRGGGIYNTGELTIVESALTQNLAFAPSSSAGSAFGGALYNFGSARIENSTLSGNSAISESGLAQGGAVQGYNITITNSTISGNTADGGSAARGGGVSFEFGFGNLIEHTTFHDNRVLGPGSNAGGAIYVDAEGGYSPHATVKGSIFSSSTGDHCAGDGDLFDAGGGNLADDATCLPTIGSTLSGLDPTLADNGGPTGTHALLPGSTALDIAGSCGLGVDQRGVGRMTPCDAGAFERLACGFLEVPAGTIDFDSVLSVCHTIIVGPDVSVEFPGSLDWTAGFLLNLKNGFVVEQGIDVELGIDPFLLPP